MALRNAKRPPHVRRLVGALLSSMAVRLVATVIVSRTLGPAVAGIYAAIGTAIEVGDRVFAGGRPESIAYFVSSGRDSSAMLSTSLRALRRRVLPSAIVGGLFALLPAVRDLGWPVGLAGAWAIGTIPVTASAKSCWRETRSATGQSTRVAIAEILRAVLTLSFALLGAGFGVAGQVQLATVTLLVGFSLSELATRLYLQGRNPLRPIGSVPPGFKTYARSAYWGSLAQPLIQRFDQLLLLIIVPANEIGIYATAVSLSLIVGVFGAGISQASYPRLEGRNTSPHIARANGMKLLIVLGLAVTPVSGLVLMFAPQLVEFAFGSAFSAAVPAARILAIGAILTSVSLVGQMTLLGMGRPKTVSWAQTAGLIVQLVLILPLTIRHGITGTALASTASYLVRLGIIVAGLRARLTDAIGAQ